MARFWPMAGAYVTDSKPSLFIVDGSIAVTGALVSAARQAELLGGVIDSVLLLPRGHLVPAARTTAFADVIELPIVNLRKSMASVIFYAPALISASFKLRRAMRSCGCQRLQLNDFYLLHGGVLRLLGFRGQIVTFVRIDPTRFGLAGRLWLTAARWYSTELVAVSRFVQTLLGPQFPSRLVYEQVSPVSGPAPAQRASPTRLLLYVGNFIEGKGQEHAVEAFHRIAEQFPVARLRFVGGDMGLDKNRRFRDRLEQAAAAGPARGRIEFHGHKDDLVSDYADAFAALNFSASESFSNTCLDASAFGLTVVATRCGGPEEIIEDGVTGFLVAVGDVAAMAEKMTWLLDHPIEAAAMGEAGRSLVGDRFSTERSAAIFRSMFDL